MKTPYEVKKDYNLDKKYIYANGVLLGQINKDGKLFQYFHDGLGSITAIYDSTGTYKNLYMYDGFGKFLKKSQSVSNNYYYAGQEKDGNPTNFYNLRARYYYPDIGRFTQEDPILQVGNGVYGFNNCTRYSKLKLNLLITSIERPQALNPYIYVINNPTNISDPTGEIVPIAFNPCLYCGACLGGAMLGCFVGCKYATDYQNCVKECLKEIPCKRLWPHRGDPTTAICFGTCWLCGLKIIGKGANIPNF